jgi:hypothetical protein
MSSPVVALRSATGAALIAATVLASGVTSVDADVIKVAVPAIGRSLGAGVTALQWTLTSYLLMVQPRLDDGPCLVTPGNHTITGMGRFPEQKGSRPARDLKPAALGANQVVV